MLKKLIAKMNEPLFGWRKAIMHIVCMLVGLMIILAIQHTGVLG